MNMYRDLVTNPSGVILDRAGRLRAFSCYNSHSGPLLLQFFDLAVAPTTGVTTPWLQFNIANAQGLALGADFFGPEGMQFRNGIAWASSSAAIVYTTTTSAKFALHALYSS